MAGQPATAAPYHISQTQLLGWRRHFRQLLYLKTTQLKDLARCHCFHHHTFCTQCRARHATQPWRPPDRMRGELHARLRTCEGLSGGSGSKRHFSSKSAALQHQQADVLVDVGATVDSDCRTAPTATYYVTRGASRPSQQQQNQQQQMNDPIQLPLADH